MGEVTGISWTDHTFNPWWGCVKVSPACQHCYAETFSKRVGQKVWGADAPRRFFGPKHWEEPLKWNAVAVKAGVRRRVFCASMADVFEDRADLIEARSDLFALIEKTDAGLDWLLLTKRPENIRALWPKGFYEPGPDWWPNLWLGTTVESNDYLARIDRLREVPAVVHFISYEPALGPLDESLRGIEWLIAGGESGAGYRPPEIDWFRRVRDRCQEVGAAFHFKQWGGINPKANGCELDGREWKEFPSPQEGRSHP